MHEIPGSSLPEAQAEFSADALTDKIENDLHWAPVDVRNTEAFVKKSYVSTEQAAKQIEIILARKGSLEKAYESMIERSDKFDPGVIDRYESRVAKMIDELNRAETILNTIPPEKLY